MIGNVPKYHSSVLGEPDEEERELWRCLVDDVATHIETFFSVSGSAWKCLSLGNSAHNTRVGQLVTGHFIHGVPERRFLLILHSNYSLLMHCRDCRLTNDAPSEWYQRALTIRIPSLLTFEVGCDMSLKETVGGCNWGFWLEMNVGN